MGLCALWVLLLGAIVGWSVVGIIGWLMVAIVGWWLLSLFAIVGCYRCLLSLFAIVG